MGFAYDGDAYRCFAVDEKGQLGENGRILLRESGTEPVIRVMVETESDELCERYVNQMVQVIDSKGYIL